MDWRTFQNALAWFKSAPAEWIESGEQNLAAAAQWIWEVLQGDFSEEQTTAQVITGTVISLIPGVDQICDVRDLIANCKKVNEDTSDKWAWVALALTLVGLVPELGSLLKGCFKILIVHGRKAMVKVSKTALDADMWKASQPFIETGIKKLNEFMARPVVKRAMKAAGWANPYKSLATLMRKTTGGLSAAKLLAQFDALLRVYQGLVDKIRKWAPKALGDSAMAQLQMIQNVRKLASSKVDQVLGPVRQWLGLMARRLDVEADMHYRATTNTVNPHHYRGVANDPEEIGKFEAKPGWVDEGDRLKYKPKDVAPVQEDWPDISDSSKNSALKSKYDTFHAAKATVIPEGEVLYRIVDPGSTDDNICWMRKAEFDKLKTKDDWRRHFAVKANWNANGEYVTYTVPKGGLNVWEGPAASQEYKNAATKKTEYTLEGGYSQIVLDPKQLDTAYLGKRQSTGWGYTSFGETLDMRGVPTLKNNLFRDKK